MKFSTDIQGGQKINILLSHCLFQDSVKTDQIWLTLLATLAENPTIVIRFLIK